MRLVDILERNQETWDREIYSFEWEQIIEGWNWKVKRKLYKTEWLKKFEKVGWRVDDEEFLIGQRDPNA